MKLKLNLILSLVAGILLAADPKPNPDLLAGQRALRAQDYAAAVASLDKALAAKAKESDMALYLKGLALFHGGKLDECIAACDGLAEAHKESHWLGKGRFLKASALVRQRKFEAAEGIYEEEANRLLSAARKQDVAGVIIRFADALAEKPEKDDLKAPPPNYNKAYNLYKKALAMEVGRELRDAVSFKAARTRLLAGNPGAAIGEFQQYLAEFDPEWTGVVGSVTRASGQKKENPKPAGGHIWEARFFLAESQLKAGQHLQSRVNLEDLLVLLDGEGEAPANLVTDARWMMLKAWQLPRPPVAVVERAVKAARDFLEAYPNDPRSVAAAWWIAQAYNNAGRPDATIAAYQDFIALKSHKLPVGDAATQRVEELGDVPAKLQSKWEKSALYHIGQIRFGQKKYAEATEMWLSYINKYPDGPNWADSQRGVINAQYQVALDAVLAEKNDEARKLFTEFLAKNPLDNRARQILFIFGQMDFVSARKLEAKRDDPEVKEADKPKEAELEAAWQKAIDQWLRLVSKYPGTEESSVALLRVAQIQEQKLGDWKAALASFQRLNWGSKRSMAQTHASLLTKKMLALQTNRKFRTDEKPVVSLTTRNIKKVTVRQYFLDLEAYFRKTHAIETIDHLDIALIEPDKQWELEVKDYTDYKPMVTEIEVPFENAKAGVCILNVSDENFEASTLVVRSDLDLVAKSSRREALVFVEDRLKAVPAEGVRLLFSDGKKVFATEETGKDGVYVGGHDELKELEGVRVFAIKDGHVASNSLGLSGLTFSSGLAAKGYLYTDRPAYMPSQRVKVRGVIRDVKDGSYISPEGQTYLVSVSDAAGRLIWEQEQDLSKFGTFNVELTLDSRAPLGNYQVTARAKESASKVYSSQFQVQRFQLEKIRLKVETSEPVYFRGETVQLDVTAEYYWGQPLVDRQVHYYLPDGRHLAAQTNEEGKLQVKFDTTGLRAGTMMTFRVSIEGENVQTMHRVLLAEQGFAINVRASQSLVLDGEPFDVEIETRTPDGKPVGKELTLAVLRREITKANSVVNGVPWLPRQHNAVEEVTVAEHKVKTDEKTGKGMLRLTLEGGGQYVLRASGADRFKQVVHGVGSVTVSDDEDATKLRFFADSDTLQVGGEAKLRLHSRLDGRLALLTFEGETILSHRVVKLKKDFNEIPLPVTHAHFPNFRVCVASMDGRELRVAHKDFRVERQLNVTVKPKQGIYPPGAEGELELTVTDQLGRPVAAELSLALIDEALFAVFPDKTAGIRDFFEKDARRQADFRISSSCAFHYTAQTHKVLKEFLNEQERLARKATEARELAGLKLDAQRLLAANKWAEGAKKNLGRLDDLMAGEGDAMAQPLVTTPGSSRNFAGQVVTGATSGGIAAGPVAEAGLGIGGMGGGGGGMGNAKGDNRRGWSPDNWAMFKGMKGKDDDENADPRVRREYPGAGVWLPEVVTDEKGKAVLKIRLPESATEWRITARGVTVETLAGQAAAKVVTRKDFFVDIKAPQSLEEGDSARILARVHNLTDYEGDVELTLTVHGGYQFKKKVAEKKLKLVVPANGGVEGLFDSLEVPLSPALKLQVEAKAGDHEDVLARAVPVRPWGLEFASHAGGVSKDDEVAFVELPKDRRDGSQWLTIAVGPDLKRSVVEMALGGSPMPSVKNGRTHFWLPPRPRTGGFAGSDLLAAVSALEFARKANAPLADRQRLASRIRGLVGSLVVGQQKDGGWLWKQNQGTSKWSVSAVNFWALCRARALEFPVHADTMKRAEAYLRGRFTSLGANDNDGKAMILFALSMNNAADFAHANRLHRERNQLGPQALAFTALAFVNLQRQEFAGELLDVLEQKLKPALVNGKELLRLDGVHNYVWACDEVETGALAALAFMRVRPASPKVQPLVEYLLHRRGASGFAVAKARGPAVAALAEYFGRAKFAAADFKLTVLVNGKELETIESKGAQPTVSLAVPHDQIVDGQNRIEFRIQGVGEYSYAVTLRGFSANLADPKSFSYPHVNSRRYYHEQLEYRGRKIGVNSSTQVRNIEIGQRVRVYVDTDYYSTSSSRYMVVEEHLPAGMMLVEGTLSGRHTHYEVDNGKITMYYPAGHYISDFSYELVGYSTGNYRVLPTVIRDVLNPGRMRVGGKSEMFVLTPDEDSKDPYTLNDGERYTLGQLNFKDGNYAKAKEFLAELFQRNRRYNEREVARMLLWIYTADGFYDAQRVIETFEILRERYPTLEIPFDKILVVGRAYRDLGEWERAYLVFRATIDASFINDVNVSAVLDDEGQFMGSIDYQEDLWREYPDTAEVTSMFFSISQALYLKSPQAHALAKQERGVAILRGGKPVRQTRVPEKIGMLRETIRLLSEFMTLFPESPLADDAAFSMANALLDLKQYDTVIEVCGSFKSRFKDSEFASGYQYMAALGHFWKHDHANALKAGLVVANGESRDRDFARYIVGQVHHAQGSPTDAIEWYGKVRDKYPDAKQAIDYFEEKRIALEEINIFQPGKPVELKLKYRNIKEVQLQVYRVDLMKLYLREKNLSKITKISLAGIAAMLEHKEVLGDGRDYIDKEKTVKLALDKEGAYLVICRGDDLFSSGLVLVTPLKIEVQEDAASGRVRANVRDVVVGRYVADVHVKAIGSADSNFRDGETDLRGIYIADNLRGKATVIARDAEMRYAFYRGEKWLGAPSPGSLAPAKSSTQQHKAPSAKGQPGLDYRQNLQMQNGLIQGGNWGAYDKLRRGQNRGVQIQRVR